MAQDSALEAIRYRGVTDFSLLDQRVLPHTVRYDAVRTVEDAFDAIREMRVRGAPAIAVTAALGVAVAAAADASLTTAAAAAAFLVGKLDYIETSRPTAVNLHNAVVALKAFVAALLPTAADGAALVAAFVTEAERLLAEDTELNEGIMKCGAAHIFAGRKDNLSDKVNVLTICNTGALATTRFGTALGVIRQLHYDGRLGQVYALETRPWNQGARLTVFECVHEKMPVTLIVDSAASFLMARQSIDAVIVGADRVCQNGDTANKIGTYNVAVAAKHHGVPFYVASPTTTMDAHTATGDAVVIEERTPTEITHNMGTMERVIAEGETLSIWNPVFDITPGALITGGIVTEQRVVEPAAAAPYYDIAAVLAASTRK
jgi:S-methyl-5-thioribose-1-phosphate isomerase